MSPARARTQTALSGDVERTNYEATAPPTISMTGDYLRETFM